MPNDEENRVAPTDNETTIIGQDHEVQPAGEAQESQGDSETSAYVEPTGYDASQVPVASPQPVLQAAGAPAQPGSTVASVNTPGVLILQWLSYAFWGWTLIALYWLTNSSVGHFINTNKVSDGYELYDSGSFLAYALAAVIVLFLIAIICDFFYTKREPVHKTGAATVIMVIHAVIFALFGIGSLIVGVFAFVNMLISSNDNQAAITMMITAAIMTVLYAVTLLRTFRPKGIKRLAPMYWTVMTISTLAIMSLGVLGPIAYTQMTKDDRAIVRALPTIAEAVNDYTDKNGKLPASLNEPGLEFLDAQDSSDAKRTVDEGLITYVPKEKLLVKSAQSLGDEGDPAAEMKATGSVSSAVFHYQLCATYKEKEAKRYYENYERDRNQQYPTVPELQGHAAGNVCYDLQTDDLDVPDLYQL